MADPVPDTKEDTMTLDLTDWFCEKHHWLNWPHDDCIGPGVPPAYALRLCAKDVARLRCLIHEIEDWAKDEHPGLRDHIRRSLAASLGFCGSQGSPESCCDKPDGHEGDWHYDSATGESWPASGASEWTCGHTDDHHDPSCIW